EDHHVPRRSGGAAIAPHDRAGPRPAVRGGLCHLCGDSDAQISRPRAQRQRPDYQSLDLPIFYRRVDQLDIVDARGAQVPVPANVPIAGGNQPSNVGRATYYPGGLRPNLQNQLTAISGVANAAALNNRITTLQGQVVQALNLAIAPVAAQFAFRAV